MRRLSFDQFEFDLFASEESLDLVISSPTRHPDLRQFLSECGATCLDGSPVPSVWPFWWSITKYLRRFAGLELPDPSECRAILVLRNDWDDLEIAIETGSLVIWYH
jgi:hypothetical protein